MARTLVWLTHSFRINSRLMASLSGECAFVYYSPYYFAGQRERDIYNKCSQANLDAFYWSINNFDRELRTMINGQVHVFKESDPIAHINSLCVQHGFDNVVIDQPLFAMWHTVKLSNLQRPFKQIDSDLIDPNCIKLTAKSRWTTHVKNINSFIANVINVNLIGYNIPGYIDDHYPFVAEPPLLNVNKVFDHLFKVMFKYKDNRNHHQGQTRMSVALHNGVIDPANVFYSVAVGFRKHGYDITDLEGPAAAILRQQAFREISIIQARRKLLTLEDDPLTWAQKLMHISAYENMLQARPKANGLTWEKIQIHPTGHKDIDFLIAELQRDRIMPNRARMLFASQVFYESLTGADALNILINTFDLIGLDGQSPNNYTQCIGALGLSYGKVLKMDRNRAWDMLGYPN